MILLIRIAFHFKNGKKHFKESQNNVRFRDSDLRELLLELGEFPNDDLDASLAMVSFVSI